MQIYAFLLVGCERRQKRPSFLSGGLNMESAKHEARHSIPQTRTGISWAKQVEGIAQYPGQRVENRAARGNGMTARNIEVQRLTFTSRRSFADVLAKLESPIGHPDMGKFRKDVSAAKTEEDLRF